MSLIIDYGIKAWKKPELTVYRPLVDSDIGKVFGVDLDAEIYFDLEYDLINYSIDAVLMDFVVPESSHLLKLVYEIEEEDEGDIVRNLYFTHRTATGDVPTSIWGQYDGYWISSYTLPNLSSINDIYYDLPKNFILVKDI